MQFEMKMPDLATTDSEIRIARWLIETGQKVERGQPLLEVETDKATMEVESVASGVLAEVRAAANEAVSVGQVIAVMEVEGASPAAAAPAAIAPDTREAAEGVPPLHKSSAGTGPSASTACERAVAHAAATPGRTSGGMFARNRAAAAAGTCGAGVPPARAAGTAAPQDSKIIALSVAERTAGKRLQESKQTIPHFYLQTSVNAAAMIARRKDAVAAKLAWDAFFVSAVAKTIAKFDRFRCRLDGERLVPIQSDAIGVAVDIDGELYVIPIDSPTTKTVARISEEIRQGVARLRSDPEARRTRPALMTVTNLGGCNVEGFIPIISPPEPAILGVGRVAATPVVRADGQIGVEHRCTITLCVDHRISSGKYAGEFLGAIVKELESL
jgi:pyruvate dehydrogenase E2 component (dihydrolipoamide acetyltransferase)